MKYYIGVFCWFLAVQVIKGDKNEDAEKFRKYAAECKEKVNATEDDINILTSIRLPSNRAQECLLDCFYRKVGLVTDKGLNKDVFLKTFDDLKKVGIDKYNKTLDTYEKCVSSYSIEINPCDAAKNYMSCWVQNLGSLVQ